LPAIICLDFSEYGHILGKTLCSGPRGQLGRQAHGGTALASRHHVRCPWDFLGLINTSRTSLVQKKTSVTPHFLQPFLKRFSRGPIRGANLFLFTFSTVDLDNLWGSNPWTVFFIPHAARFFGLCREIFQEFNKGKL
jgi:hypothetical protein